MFNKPIHGTAIGGQVLGLVLTLLIAGQLLTRSA